MKRNIIKEDKSKFLSKILKEDEQPVAGKDGLSIFKLGDGKYYIFDKVAKSRAEAGKLLDYAKKYNYPSYDTKEVAMEKLIGKSIKEEAPDTEKSDDEIAAELAEALGNAELAEEIKGSLDWESGRYSSFGKAGKFEADGTEYNIIENEDEADRIAIEQTKESIENEPELFNKDALGEHITIDETTRRQIALDDVDSRRSDFEYDIQKGKYKDVFDSVDKYKDEYEALQERLDNDEDVEGEIEALAKKAIDEWGDEKVDEIEEALKDPVQYFVHDQGIYTEEELMKQNFISIDADAASKEFVQIDGWAHFLSHYDGNYDTTSSGFVFFRE